MPRISKHRTTLLLVFNTPTSGIIQRVSASKLMQPVTEWADIRPRIRAEYENSGCNQYSPADRVDWHNDNMSGSFIIGARQKCANLRNLWIFAAGDKWSDRSFHMPRNSSFTDIYRI
jgi:hypothetical protein